MTGVDWTDGHITGEVEAGEGQMVPYDGGWRATVDGERAEVEQALGAFLGIRLAAGTHRVELTNTPVGLAPGAAISGLSLLVLLALLGRRARRRGRGAKG